MEDRVRQLEDCLRDLATGEGVTEDKFAESPLLALLHLPSMATSRDAPRVGIAMMRRMIVELSDPKLREAALASLNLCDPRLDGNALNRWKTVALSSNAHEDTVRRRWYMAAKQMAERIHLQLDSADWGATFDSFSATQAAYLEPLFRSTYYLNSRKIVEAHFERTVHSLRHDLMSVRHSHTYYADRRPESLKVRSNYACRLKVHWDLVHLETIVAIELGHPLRVGERYKYAYTVLVDSLVDSEPEIDVHVVHSGEEAMVALAFDPDCLPSRVAYFENVERGTAVRAGELPDENVLHPEISFGYVERVFGATSQRTLSGIVWTW